MHLSVKRVTKEKSERAKRQSKKIKTRELVKGGATWGPELVRLRGAALLEEVVRQKIPDFDTADVSLELQRELDQNFSTA